jgi:threonine dehydratase
LTLYLGQLTFGVIKQKVKDILTVTDPQLIATMKFFGERMKIVVEPTGCLGAAAIMHGALSVPKGARVGVILSGGNVDLKSYAGFVTQD